MTNTTDAQFSETHWKTLRYFSVYRLGIAALLFASLFSGPLSFFLLSHEENPHQTLIIVAYFLMTIFSLAVLHFHQRHFNWQLSIQVLLDVLLVALLTYLNGGMKSGLGIMLLVTLAEAGLVGQRQLALFYAAMATLGMLSEQTFRAMTAEYEVGEFFQVGLLGAGFFVVAISARLLASRVLVNEALARKRGEELRNQTLISQHIIEEMLDGILVLDREGKIKQHNPRTEELLGLENPKDRALSSYSTELAQRFSTWSTRGGNEPVMVRAPASDMQLRARFMSTKSSEGDVLVFLEDLGRLQEQARQLKLAALGRLTANIAHEIRNPLSAIKHAGELMREDPDGQTNDRLLRIILDNAQRVERIVSDILELGRRDRAHRELIDLRSAIPAFVEEFCIKEELSKDVVAIDISGRATLSFDRSHFQQILWNLVGNALRYSQKEMGSIRLLVQDEPYGHRVDLHVIDDGTGIDASFREHIFEPFFTTHSRGTGLGLYIARELCEANSAQIELLSSESGTDFCISGRATE